MAGEKQTVVQKMCQYICCCFSCLQRPDESKTEYNHEQLAQLAQDEKGSIPGRYRVPQGASQVTNKRSQKQQLKLSRVNQFGERQNTGPQTEDGEARPMGW